MKSIHKTFPLFIAVVLSLLAAGAAVADPVCLTIHSHASFQVTGDPGCASPVGLCAVTEYNGSLEGEGEFTGLTFDGVPTDPFVNVALATGDHIIHTASGDLYTKDIILLSIDAGGEFAELDTVVGGTGDFEDATGRITLTGTFDGVRGEGMAVGKICWP